MNNTLLLTAITLIFTAQIRASVTERLAHSDKKISEIRKNINSKNLAAASDCRQSCKSCSGCKKSI